RRDRRPRLPPPAVALRRAGRRVRRPRARARAAARRDRRHHARPRRAPDGLLRRRAWHPADAEVVPLVHERLPRRRAVARGPGPHREPRRDAPPPRPARSRRAVPAGWPPPEPPPGRAPAAAPAAGPLPRRARRRLPDAARGPPRPAPARRRRPTPGALPGTHA